MDLSWIGPVTIIILWLAAMIVILGLAIALVTVFIHSARVQNRKTDTQTPHGRPTAVDKPASRRQK